MIKAGQIYNTNFDCCDWSVIAITNTEDGIISMINPEGVVDFVEESEFQYQDTRLMAEYPTWKEAINSKEFKND